MGGLRKEEVRKVPLEASHRWGGQKGEEEGIVGQADIWKHPREANQHRNPIKNTGDGTTWREELYTWRSGMMGNSTKRNKTELLLNGT